MREPLHRSRYEACMLRWCSFSSIAPLCQPSQGHRCTPACWCSGLANARWHSRWPPCALWSLTLAAPLMAWAKPAIDLGET